MRLQGNLYTAQKVEDIWLAAWWSDLANSGELEDIFSPEVQNLSGFLGMFQGSTQLYYCRDHTGLVCAVWFEPILSGSFVGMWIRKDRRRTPGPVLFIRDIVEEAAEKLPVLMGLTKQPMVVALAEKLGFRHMGLIERLLPGDATHLIVKETAPTPDTGRNGYPDRTASAPRQLVY